MFESSERLTGEIEGLLETIRGLGHGRYACLLEPKGVVFESAEPEMEAAGREIRRLLESRAAAVFALPGRLAGEGPSEDVFSDWDQDDFFLAVINGRVALVVACPDPGQVQEQAMRPLRALVDRLFRLKEAYRLDAQGRGLFFGSPKLDIVVAGRARGDADA